MAVGGGIQPQSDRAIAEPKVVLVVAGNQSQFDYWMNLISEERHLFRFALRYVHVTRMEDILGFLPSHVERIETIGSWWNSPARRDEQTWIRIELLNALVGGLSNVSRRRSLTGREMEFVPMRPLTLCRCSADGGGCGVCVTEGEEGGGVADHSVRLRVESPALGTGRTTCRDSMSAATEIRVADGTARAERS